jgi:hypothetical protein
MFPAQNDAGEGGVCVDALSASHGYVVAVRNCRPVLLMLYETNT